MMSGLLQLNDDTVVSGVDAYSVWIFCILIETVQCGWLRAVRGQLESLVSKQEDILY